MCVCVRVGCLCTRIRNRHEGMLCFFLFFFAILPTRPRPDPAPLVLAAGGHDELKSHDGVGTAFSVAQHRKRGKGRKNSGQQPAHRESERESGCCGEEAFEKPLRVCTWFVRVVAISRLDVSIAGERAFGAEPLRNSVIL